MATDNIKRNVFISYSRHDYVDEKGEVIPGNCISKIMEVLDKNGISYWIDKEGVYSGDEFKGLLSKAIMQADVFIFVSSVSSNNSKWTAKEINVAVYMGKTIIPVRIDDSTYNPSVMLDLVGLDFINYKNNPILGLRELVKSVKRNITQSDVDVIKIKEEIKALEKEGEHLYAQQKRIMDNIIAQMRLIGEDHSPCPVCGESVEINKSFCPICGWAYIPFQSKKMDEKRLAKARDLWNKRFLDTAMNEEPPSPDLPRPIIELIGDMIEIEGGSFTMGATREQGEDAFDDEKPAHKVTLSTFSIGKFPITQDQWEAVMGNNPSYFKGEKLPVESVSWYDCQEFAKKLSEMTGMHFRLPTEAEWEYAARGGKKGKRYKFSGGHIIDQIGWYNDNSGGTSHEVGKKSPNELGLYDMSGNIWEWVQDWKGDFTEEDQINPTGPETGIERICRGGGWNREIDRARVSYRGDDQPDLRYCSLGLRIACSVQQ